MGSLLPIELTRCLADAEIEVVSWSAETGQLVLRVRKDIGEESGLLRFQGVARLNLEPRFQVLSLVAAKCMTTDDVAEEGDLVFRFEDAWGGSGFVVAESISYEIEP